MYQSKQHEHTYIHKHYLIFYIAYVRDGVTNEWRKNGLFAKSSKKTSFSSLKFSRSVMSDSSTPWTAAVRLHCPSPAPRVCSNSCPLSQWCHHAISSSVVPFSSCPQSFPASGSFPMSQFFTSGGQSIGVSASVLPVNIQDWFPLGLSGLSSLESKGLSRVFNTTVQKHQFFHTLE